MNQYDLRIRKARGLCAPVPRICSNCRRCNEANSCSSPQARRNLALSKVTSLIRWRHAPPQELAHGLASVPAASRLDHMTRRQFLRSGEPRAPKPRQVQQWKCCGRYRHLSSRDDAGVHCDVWRNAAGLLTHCGSDQILVCRYCVKSGSCVIDQ